MSSYFDKAQVEVVTVDYFRELGYEHIHGPQIAPDGETPERADYGQVALTGQLRDTLLSKLLSGKIDPPTAEAIAEEVVS